MLLKVGSKGDDVKKLQAKLGLAADGNFGPGTEAKVKAWQAANGLTADGLVGDGTWAKMFAGSAPAPTAPVAAVAPSDFKLANLKGHIPDSVIAQIPDTAAKFGITTPLRLAHLLGQCAHESGGFRFVTENLNYKAESLMKTFPKYFHTRELADAYAKKPEKIANRIYASRMGNGDEASGDGFRYRGRGLIQLTGKENYSWFAASLEISPEEAAEYMATFEGAAQSACWFWETNNLNKEADANDIKTMTRKINGGFIGLDDRIKHYNHALHVLGA